MRTVADALLQELARWGISRAFLVPGAQIDPLASSLFRGVGPQPVLACHELAAGFMADGYARASGLPGLVLTIGGPGAAYALPAAVNARIDRSPVLVLTGNIPRAMQDRRAFQDAGPNGSNDAGFYRAAIGGSYLCESPDMLFDLLYKIKRDIDDDRPAHLMVPIDVQNAPWDGGDGAAISAADCTVGAASLPSDWMACGRLVVLAGSRSIASSEEIKGFADRFTVPVATTLAARGVVPENSLMAMGHFGFMAHPRAKSALSSSTPLAAERIVAVGLDEFAPEHFPGIEVVVAPPGALKQWLLNESATPPAATVQQRRDWIAACRQLDRPGLPDAVPGAISYGHLVETVARRMPAGTIHVFDSGQVRRVGVARLTCLEPRTLLVADGMAPMGWAIGAAIGAAFACPNRSVATFVGDGSMLMHGLELITAVRYRLPILFVLCENGVYGSLSLRDPSSPMAALPGMDWCAFSRSLGIETRHAGCLQTLHTALDGVAEMSGPRLVVAKVPAVDPDAGHGDTGIAWLSSLK